MNQCMKWISIILAAVMMLSFCSACAEDTVLAEVNGVQIMQSEVESYLVLYYYYGYIDDYTDYSGMVDQLVEYTLEMQMLSDNGYFDFTEEEEEALRTEAISEKENYIEEYISYNLSEDSDEARDALRVQAEEYYAGYEDEIYSELLNQAAYDRWYLDAMENAVTDDDVRAAFDSFVAEDKETYENDIIGYEIDYYSGYLQFFVPEGYRNVLRVLIPVDEALTDAYIQAQAAWEETLDENNNPTESTPEAAQKMKDAENAVLESVKETTDAVYAALAEGVPFTEVIAEYGNDLFMTEEYGGLEEGYPVHRESILYERSFVLAAFGEDMQKPGDWSAPVVGSDGVSILYYLSDLPSGAIELTDELFAYIKSYLEENAAAEIMEQQLAEYRENSTVIIYTEAINAAEEAVR